MFFSLWLSSGVCVCLFACLFVFWSAEVSYVLLCGEVQEQEPVHSSAGGPRQRLHHSGNIRPGAAVLDRHGGSVCACQPGLAQHLHRGWVSKSTQSTNIKIHDGSFTLSLCVTGKQLWSGLAWGIWVSHMSLMQQRESGIMCWLVLITTLAWTSSTTV